LSTVLHRGAVDGEHLDAGQAGLSAEPEHLPEQLGQRQLVTLAKPRDGRLIGNLVGGDYAAGDVLDAAPLDSPRGAFADRVGVTNNATIIDGSCAARPWPSAR